MVTQSQYAKFDTTNAVPNRARRTFEATQTSRRLAMFQVWFMQKNAQETLQSYNLRLGRPAEKVRYGVLAQTKKILSSDSWWQYFSALGVELRDDAAIDELLRFAVYNSAKKGYHRRGGNSSSLPIGVMRMPSIVGGTSGGISKPGQCGSRTMERVKLTISSKPKSNPWSGRKWSIPKPNAVNAPTPMPLQRTVPAQMCLHRMDAQAQARARSQHIMAQLHSRRPIRPALAARVGANQTTQARVGRVRNMKPPQPVGTKTADPSPFVGPAVVSASEIDSVSPSSSSPSSSKQFAYADSSSKAQSDDTVISLSSASPDSRVRRRRTEVTAQRDVYDFKLKRDINTHARSGIVTRQLNAAKMSNEATIGMSLRNTLGIGLEHAGSAALLQRVEVRRKIRLYSDVIDCDMIADCTYAHRVPHSIQAQPQRMNEENSTPMSKAQRRRQRRKALKHN